MMLKQINKAYWYIGIILYVVFSFNNIMEKNFLFFHLVSFLTFIAFGIIIVETNKCKLSFFTKQNLFVIVFGCSLFEVILFHLLSYYIDGDTFVFSKIDALMYFTESQKMCKMSFEDSLNYLSKTLLFGFDDWGAFLWITTIFRIIPSQFFLSFLHCIVGGISAIMLFDIGKLLMIRRYAFFAALTFSIASFTSLMHSVCMKETVFICLVIASFHAFYSFLRYKKKRYLLLSLVWISATMLFRIPVALILAFSFGLTWVLIYSKGLVVLILGVVLSLVIYSSSLFSMTYERYLRGGNVELIIERKNELAKGGGIANQMADPLAALIGPFPSVAMKDIKNTPLNASGLIYRLLLAAPFFAGGYYAFRYKYKKVYPLIIFFLANVIGVAISVKGMEARLSLPHLSMMYLVAFWWLANYDCRRIRLRLSQAVVNCYFFIILIISVIWNLRVF